jgi:hypothetical protein
MKKILLIAGLGFVTTTAGVTAAVMNNGKKKATKDTEKKESPYKKECSRSHKTACY